jgi:hypothetical protein
MGAYLRQGQACKPLTRPSRDILNSTPSQEAFTNLSRPSSELLHALL